MDRLAHIDNALSTGCLKLSGLKYFTKPSPFVQSEFDYKPLPKSTTLRDFLLEGAKFLLNLQDPATHTEIAEMANEAANAIYGHVTEHEGNQLLRVPQKFRKDHAALLEELTESAPQGMASLAAHQGVNYAVQVHPKEKKISVWASSPDPFSRQMKNHLEDLSLKRGIVLEEARGWPQILVSRLR